MKIRSCIINVFGRFCSMVVKLGEMYRFSKYKFSRMDGTISMPCCLAGAENMDIEQNVSIGPNSTLYSTGAKLSIKRHTVIGPNVTIITGDHDYYVGKWLDELPEATKDNKRWDADVVIEEDVWIGSNVTILKGVSIGREAIVAAGSVVTKDVEPYSIVGGVPAKKIKMKWTPEEIQKHESILYK